MRPVRFVSAGVLLSVLLLAGCGGQDAPAEDTRPGTSRPAGGAFPVTIEAANGGVEIPAEPKRMVVLGPTATESLFAVGAGKQVVAVDDQSDHPEEAPKTKLSGFKPNAEAITGYDPDLVVLSDDQDGIVKALEKLELPVLHLPAATRLDDAYDQIEKLGTATGHADEAKKVTGEMRKKITGSVEESKTDQKLTYYHEVGPELYTITSKTFAGQIYALFGLENIADKADKAQSGYPQLTPEYPLEAKPDLIFLADTVCCNESADTVAKRSGWKELPAVKNDLVFELDDSIASRWGPRLPEFVEKVGAAVQRAADAG